MLPKTQNASSSPGSAQGPVRAEVTDVDAGSGVSSWSNSVACCYREPHACLKQQLLLPDLRLKQSTNFGVRLDKTTPEWTEAVQRAPLAVLSALPPLGMAVL